MNSEWTNIIFALASLAVGVFGLVKGKLTIGIEDTDRYDRVITGFSVKVVSVLLFLASFILFSGNKMGFVVLAVGIVIAFLLSRFS